MTIRELETLIKNIPDGEKDSQIVVCFETDDGFGRGAEQIAFEKWYDWSGKLLFGIIGFENDIAKEGHWPSISWDEKEESDGR